MIDAAGTPGTMARAASDRGLFVGWLSVRCGSRSRGLLMAGGLPSCQHLESTTNRPDAL